MRLNKIKLAGFKSFVEPTTVSLPGSIVGVVGPNGCGKSNIIDAVRWVMGESSPRYLRGESMADVIFNGSDARKPVSTASIELIFDNTDAATGSKYSAYNEISVRRQVNREGQSSYYFNGARCRRRDISDVFLGTGLGPRSYSLIEQSMIARIIEARPEELRAHLEEAAGISFYRERRKETERRMLDTLENLERLNDIRSELGRQLDKLTRQARAATRYRELKVKQRERQAQLHVLKLQALDSEQQRVRCERSAHEGDLEAQLARQSALEHEIEDSRACYAECNGRVNELQAQYYTVGSEITRVEQQIDHRRELGEASRQELERNREALFEIKCSFDQDQDKLAQLKSQQQELVPAVNEVVAAEAAARETADSWRNQLEEWRQRWDRFSEEAARSVRIVQVERARIEQLEQRSYELTRRAGRLQEETDQLIRDDPEAELAQLAERERSLLEALAELEQRHQTQQAALGELRERIAQLVDELDEVREALHRDRARLTSLETIQQAALGEDETLRTWLEGLELDGERRLSQWIDVQSGWEHAVETVLGSALQAIVTERTRMPGEALRPPSAGTVTLFTPSADEAPPSPALAFAPALRDKVSAPWALDDLLGHVYCVDDLDSACTLAADLDTHESVVTPEGVWLGRRWVRLPGTNNPAAGVIARERELEALRSGITLWQERLAALQSEQSRLRSELTGAEATFEALREELAGRQRDLASERARAESLLHRRDQIRQRRLVIDQEQTEIAATRQDTAEVIRTAQARLQEALERGEALERERALHNEERQRLQTQLATAQNQCSELQARLHELTLQKQSVATARAALEESVTRLQARRERLLNRDAELDAVLAQLDAPEAELESERERLLVRQRTVEEQLREARRELDESGRRLRELEPQRSEAGQRAVELRHVLESARLREQELKIRAQAQAEQLGELGYESESVAAELDPELTEAACAQELSRLQEQITRLEPVNLAAIDECRDLEERKAYIEGQHTDLTVALQTLESAIRHIDQETRRRFKETFEQVDQRLRALFPRLFGGGQAHLELTGEDLLEAAITIMARPPGKKITSLHLLSSGEKALTAVSLIFALFELNPAPFCMLDEVDAPLDEANVGRFCDLLKEQSARVQFIMITHNKTTMQVASHLLGITMNEPGVSRLVAVDLAQAVELAAV
ncbi:MAG: chromosome segregation protein SMC [Nitrococcus mobilis]|nr:chromosome segregation protein SMC [Nitrococcus mobilis]